MSEIKGGHDGLTGHAAWTEKEYRTLVENPLRETPLRTSRRMWQQD